MAGSREREREVRDDTNNIVSKGERLATVVFYGVLNMDAICLVDLVNITSV